jgi:Anaphase-promoting complex subunit 4 WD40 domain/WD domain, G-beta repeat
MRRVLLRLVEVSESGEITRRRVSLEEMKIRGVPDADIQQIVDLLTAPEARLLIASRSINTGGIEPVTWLEVSHEALNREWDRFKSWVTASVEDLRYETELRKSAQDWQNSGRDPAYLLLGKRLSRAEIWMEDSEVMPVQRELIEASLLARSAASRAEKDRLEREVQLQRQSVRRARLAAGATVLLLVAALIGVFAVAQTNAALAASEANLNNTNDRLEEQVAITQRNEAAARSLAVASSASQALADNDPDLALALAVAANSSEDTPPQAERALADIALATGTRLRIPTESRVTALDFTPNNTRLAVGMQNGTVVLIEVTSGAIIQRFTGHQSTVTDVSVSPDGTQLLTASSDTTQNFILWDIISGQPAQQWTAYDNQKVNSVAFAQAGLPINVTDDVTQIATSADGQLIVVGTRDGSVRRIDETGSILWDVGPTSSSRAVPRVSALAVNRAGTQILAGFNDGSMMLLEAEFGNSSQTFIALDNGCPYSAFRVRCDRCW